MHHVIQLHFDKATEDRLRKAAETLEAAGLNLSGTPAPRPHMTLASGSPADVEKVSVELEKAFRTFPTQDVEFSYIGLFPIDAEHHVLYAGVSPSQELCKLQETVYEIFKRNGAEPFPHARPGVMVFHSTLAMKISAAQLPRAMEMLKALVPLTGKFTNAGLVEYTSATEKASFALAGKKLDVSPPHARNTCPSPKK